MNSQIQNVIPVFIIVIIFRYLKPSELGPTANGDEMKLNYGPGLIFLSSLLGICLPLFMFFRGWQFSQTNRPVGPVITIGALLLTAGLTLISITIWRWSGFSQQGVSEGWAGRKTHFVQWNEIESVQDSAFYGLFIHGKGDRVRVSTLMD